MSFVLTTASTVDCSHMGPVALAAANKLTINGMSVLLLSDISGASITCLNPTDPNTQSKPCMTVISAAGAAAKLTVSGAGVALDTLSGTTDGHDPSPATLPPTISAEAAGQSLLTAQ
jgi:hypothetical protein